MKKSLTPIKTNDKMYCWVRTVKGEQYLMPVSEEDIKDGVTEICLSVTIDSVASPEEVSLWIK